MWRLMVSRPESAWMTRRASCPNAATGRPTTRTSAGARMSVPRVLNECRIEVHLVLGDGHQDMERLDAGFRHRIDAERVIELAPALQVEHALRLEGQLPAPLLAHRGAELVLAQSHGQIRQLGPRSHQVDRAVRSAGGPIG